MENQRSNFLHFDNSFIMSSSASYVCYLFLLPSTPLWLLLVFELLILSLHSTWFAFIRFHPDA